MVRDNRCRRKGMHDGMVRAGLIFAVAFVSLVGCSPVRVRLLTVNEYQPTQHVEQLQRKPTAPHIEIARLRIKANLTGGMDALRREAQKIGAHAFYIADHVELAIGGMAVTSGGNFVITPGAETWAIAIRYLEHQDEARPPDSLR